ncbi:MAG: CBS domain-containing protein [Thermoproteota archaeon]|nr:CBS domain-containing protein [Thermoproteota archaeon]
MSLQVEDVMIKDVITVDADSTVKDAAKIMNRFEIGSLIVVKDSKAVGIMTERDVLKRVVAVAEKPEKTLVEDVMSKPLIVVEPEMELEDAVKLMFKMKIKKLPVVKNGKLVGLVSLTDIARFQPQMIKILKKMSQTYSSPRRMKKVVDYYIS